MKLPVVSLAFVLGFAVLSLSAQEQLQGFRVSILSVGGESSWGVGIDGHAVGWALTIPHHHVAVAARLGNGGGFAPVDAYLMRAIGPEASEADEVARTAIELPYPFLDWVTLFVDLDLEPGQYWLVVGKPRERAFSSINWVVASPMMVQSSCDVLYLGSKSYTFLSDAAEYLPASKFQAEYEPYGFQIALTDRTGAEGSCFYARGQRPGSPFSH